MKQYLNYETHLRNHLQWETVISVNNWLHVMIFRLKVYVRKLCKNEFVWTDFQESLSSSCEFGLGSNITSRKPAQWLSGRVSALSLPVWHSALKVQLIGLKQPNGSPLPKKYVSNVKKKLCTSRSVITDGTLSVQEKNTHEKTLTV